MIKKFLDYLKLERNYSSLTVQEYGDDLARFQKYFEDLDCHISWDTVDADIIRGWMESMMDKGNSASSVNRRLSALRSFYKFALKYQLVDKDPSRGIRGPKKAKVLPQFMKEKEIDTLLEPEMWQDGYQDCLARTLILCFYETGIRLEELIDLDDGDVSFAKRELKVTGKRNKQRIIPFGEELATTLQGYMKRRDHDVARISEALFVTRKGERMNRNKVRYLVKKNISRVTTLREQTPHVLRHTFATAMLNHDASIESIRKLLGHESISTTEIYAHTTFEQLKHVYQHAHPRA